MLRMTTIMMVAAITAYLYLSSSAYAKENWTVNGRVVVTHVLPELSSMLGNTSPVEGVTVKLSARSKILSGWGTWNSWGKVVTNKDGEFTFSEQHGGDRRQFKIEILFDSDRLLIKQGDETSVKLDNTGFPIDIHLDLTDKDWYEVWNDNAGAALSGRMAGKINLGDVAMPKGIVQQHADLWTLYGLVLDHFKSFGPEYAFKDKVVVKYPMSIGNNNSNFASYSNPVTRRIYIKGSEFFSRTMLHELMHQWSYDRTRGEDFMAWQLAKHANTHQIREETTFVPFQEAFAEWSSYRVLIEISGGKLLNFTQDIVYKYPQFPINHATISALLGSTEQSVANVDHTELGWHSLFNILTYPLLDHVDFNKSLFNADSPVYNTDTNNKIYAYIELITNKSCPDKRTGYTFKDVLGIFQQYPSKGIKSYLGKNEQDFRHFLDRAGAVLPGLEAEKIKDIKSYLNPAGKKNPCI